MKLNLITLCMALGLSMAYTSVAYGHTHRILQTQTELEREANFPSSLNFTSDSNNQIVIAFTISKALDANEMDELNELTSENADRISVEINGLTVIVKLNADLSNCNVWGKVFFTMGITQYTFGSTPEQIKQPFDMFCAHFNLQ